MRTIYQILLIFCLLSFVSCQKKTEVDFRNMTASQAMKEASSANRAIFLFIYQDDKNPYSKVFLNEIFKDEAIANFFNGHFVNVSLKAGKEGDWPDLAGEYGVYQYPTLLLLTPEAALITDIAELGTLGYDADGNLPCRPQMLRIAKLADRYLQYSDSAFFAADNWAELNQVNMRPGSLLFDRVARNGDFVQSLHGNQWDMMMDFTMAAASLRLMIYENGKAPRTNDFRVNAYYQALETYPFPLKERYRLYADVNIAYGLGDITKARQLAYQAFKNGVIQEFEYLQLYAKL